MMTMIKLAANLSAPLLDLIKNKENVFGFTHLIKKDDQSFSILILLTILHETL